MIRSELIQCLGQYRTNYPEEEATVDKFLELLAHPRAFHRDHLPGHITGSSWILTADRSRVLLVLHAKLRRWLQPGGHADGDEDVLAVARREAHEETGLTALAFASNGVFDIDVHLIPARSTFPEHFHYDVRFLFLAEETSPLIISDESHDLKWVPISQVESLTRGEPSVMRMVTKSAQKTLS